MHTASSAARPTVAPGWRRLLIAACVAFVASASAVEVNYSLRLPAEEIQAGSRAALQLIVINLATDEVRVELPVTVPGVLTTAGERRAIRLEFASASAPVLVPAQGFMVVGAGFEVPSDLAGAVELQFDEPAPLRARFTITADETHDARPRHDRFGDSARPTAISRIERHFEGNFGVYEPMYFLYGSEAPAAKFQFSFRYRLVAEDGRLAEHLPALNGINLAYTQRSLWDIRGDSSPFYDTSYLPEIGYLFLAPAPEQPGFVTWLGWQASLQHESNGKSGADSRSFNTVFLRPAMILGDIDGWHVTVAPRLLAYLSKSDENRDIAEYRGYGELRAVFGRNRGPALSVLGRVGRSFDHGALQLDLTVPTRLLSSSVASFIHVQYWNGYGESLLDYNRRSEVLRAGIALVR